MDTPVSMPFLERRRDGNLHVTKGPQSDGSNTFIARSFVKLSSGALTKCVTADVTCYGWCPDASKLATDQPPVALFGENHWVFDPRDCQFVMNVSDAAGHIGQAAGAPQLSAVAVGGEYGLVTDANGIQMVNSADTTNKIFRVVQIYPGQALTDYNGKVLVEVIGTTIQG